MAIPKLKFWNIVNSSEDEAELYVYGPIVNGDGWVYEYFGMEATDQVEFVRELNALGAKKNIAVYINSDGGDVYAAHTIHNVLKRNQAFVTVYIDGIAASAASVIAMAADKLIMPVNATLMIHDPLIGISGYYNAEDLADMKDLLDQVKNSIVAAYMSKSNLSDKEIAKLMTNETYMTGKQALEMGFADEVLYDKTVEVVNAGRYAIVNSLAVDTSKMKNNPFLKHEGEGTNMSGTPASPINSPVPTAPPAVPPVAAPQAAANPVPFVDAATVERERLKGIDAIAANIDSELVNDAKYTNPITAEQLAFKAMKEGKMLNVGLFNQAVAANQAAGTGGVHGQTLDQGGEKEYDLNNLKDVNAVFSTFAAASQSGRPQNLRRG
ncbi:head maturation protease, ClpP-related [Paenibacillus monticola]|nr:head maturation protease, ClpP-related [Paenibacillus monticola]